MWSGPNARTWLSDGCHGAVFSHGASDDVSAGRLELLEDRAKALVGLMARPIRVRHQPLDSGWKGRRDDEDLFCRIQDACDLLGQLVKVGHRCAGQHQQPMDL